MRRVLFVLPDLRHGGAERVTTTLLRHLPRERWEPHLALVQRIGELESQVPDDVPVHDLGAARARRALGRLARTVRQLRPHAVFSTLGFLSLGVLAARVLFPTGTRVVVREPTVLSEEIARKRFPVAWRAAYRLLYPRANAIVCPAEATARDLSARFGIPAGRMRLVRNPVEVERIRAAATGARPYTSAGPHVVGLGRLSAEKGYDRAIRAVAELRRARPGAELWLLGEGPERGALEACARDLGVAEGVHLPGFVANPYPWLGHADAFVQTSHYEGMPNALLEALASGTQVVAFDAPGGTREVVEAAAGARLVPRGDVGALAAALGAAIDSGGNEVALPPGFSVGEVVAAVDALLTDL